MCLAVIDKKKPNKTGRGWKTVERWHGTHGRSVHSSVVGYAFRFGQWAKADTSTECLILSVFGEIVGRYASGFHIWLKREDAERNARYCHDALVRVEYRKARLSGSGDGHWAGHQVIADEVKILRRYPVREKKA